MISLVQERRAKRREEKQKQRERDLVTKKREAKDSPWKVTIPKGNEQLVFQASFCRDGELSNLRAVKFWHGDDFLVVVISKFNYNLNMANPGYSSIQFDQRHSVCVCADVS